MYLVISIEGYVEEIDNSDVRYLFIGPVSSNKEVLNKFTEVWKAISDQVLKINGSIKILMEIAIKLGLILMLLYR